MKYKKKKRKAERKTRQHKIGIYSRITTGYNKKYVFLRKSVEFL